MTMVPVMVPYICQSGWNTMNLMMACQSGWNAPTVTCCESICYTCTGNSYGPSLHFQPNHLQIERSTKSVQWSFTYNASVISVCASVRARVCMCACMRAYIHACMGMFACMCVERENAWWDVLMIYDSLIVYLCVQNYLCKWIIYIICILVSPLSPTSFFAMGRWSSSTNHLFLHSLTLMLYIYIYVLTYLLAGCLHMFLCLTGVYMYALCASGAVKTSYCVNVFILICNHNNNNMYISIHLFMFHTGFF